MKRQFRRSMVGAVVCALIGAGAARPEEPSGATRVFERLGSLVGEWSGAQSGTAFQVTYEITADGSALMERFSPAGGAMMVTMFTVDGDHLIATHYCSARNQPQMATERIVDPRAKSVSFSLVRITGLNSPGEWHNTALVLTLEDSDHLTQEWTYSSRGETGTTVFHLTRERHEP